MTEIANEGGNKDILAARKKVVVLGSGWGALSFVRKLDPEEFEVTVVSPRPFFFYTPLLVGSTTGVVSPGAIIEPLRDNVPECEFLRVACKDVDWKVRAAALRALPQLAPRGGPLRPRT